MQPSEPEQPKPPLWSFITVAYNSAEVMRHHWAQARPSNVEWIVVDNSSTDDSVAVAGSLGADRVIELPTNVGFSAANNVGFRASSGQFVVFANPDVRADYASLSRLESELTVERGIVSPQLVGSDGALQPNGRSTPSLKNKVLSRLGRAGVVDDYYRFADTEEPVHVDWFIGAVVIAEREVFEQLGADGPWDSHFFVYYEDSDLGLRAWQAGLTVRVLGGARWLHGWERATTSFNWAAWKLEIASLLKFYRRYPALVLGRGHGRWPSASRKRRRRSQESSYE